MCAKPWNKEDLSFYICFEVQKFEPEIDVKIQQNINLGIRSIVVRYVTLPFLNVNGYNYNINTKFYDQKHIVLQIRG